MSDKSDHPRTPASSSPLLLPAGKDGLRYLKRNDSGNDITMPTFRKYWEEQTIVEFSYMMERVREILETLPESDASTADLLKVQEGRLRVRKLALRLLDAEVTEDKRKEGADLAVIKCLIYEMFKRCKSPKRKKYLVQHRYAGRGAESAEVVSASSTPDKYIKSE